MTNLIPCMDCGQLISPTADPCPKCKSEYPLGVYCKVCTPNSLEYLTESPPFPVNQALTRGRRTHYHPECVQRVLKVPDNFACTDCGMPVTKLWDWEKLYNSNNLDGPCPECGKPHLIAGKICLNPGVVGATYYLGTRCCYGCKLPILLWHKVRLQSWGIGEDSDLYHDFCFAKKSYLEERHNRLLESKKAERYDARAAAEVQRLRRNAASKDNALSGAFVGAVLGGIVMGFSGCVSCVNNLGTQHNDFNLFNGLFYGAIGGAVIGIVVGILIGQNKD